MMNGDERYMPARDKGAQRRFTRDVVDARRSFGEYFMLVILVVLFAGFLQGTIIGYIAQNAMYVILLLLIIDSIILVVSLNRRLKAKFGERERGLNFYAIMRNMQLRRMRMPKAMVKRGEYPK